MQTDILAIDFGTSNSAAAIATERGVRRISVEQAGETLPTAVFFPADEGPMQIGARASEALIAGEEGRYMRALKSVLGLPLMQEKRLICGRRRTLSDIITAFLSELRQRAEAQTGRRFRGALSGRPVHFHTNDLALDAQAEADLRACYLAAGFDEVRFLAEPEAAAIASHGMGRTDEIGLVVDIGGGTSDFSVFRSTNTGPEILASHGIRLGGTDFDHAVSMAHAMPQLGLGGQLRRQMGQGLLPVPRAPYVDLATWAKIPFLYTGETRRAVADMVRLAVEPARIGRFATVLEMELGHELAFAVERGKIAANSETGTGQIEMEFIELGLTATLTRDALNTVLAENRALLRQAMSETMNRASLGPDQIGRVIFVGGSSLMRFVADEIAALCPAAEQLYSDAFTAVVDGLALAAYQDGAPFP
ncbi:MAG: Hsp70 family protein [Paracoccaceae bacterium]